jgi:dihydroorotate dehydrogenase (NAD+) catalytic subunit
MVASGTAGHAHELAPYVPLERLGAFIPKTVTRRARRGNPPPRTVETPSGLLNSIGLDNDGVDVFLSEHLPHLRQLRATVVVNIAGRDYDEFMELAERIGTADGVAALELNLSCPNVSQGVDFSVDPALTAKVVAGTRDVCPLPVIAKLTPNVTDVVAIALAAAEAGADAVTLVNTLLGMAIDWRRRRPMLGNVTGGLSGPAIKPVALRMVWQVASRLDVPVIGVGGISTLDDALEFLVAGARAVQIGTANFFDPTVSGRIIEALPKALEVAGLDDVNQLIGTLEVAPEAAAIHKPSVPV